MQECSLLILEYHHLSPPDVCIVLIRLEAVLLLFTNWPQQIIPLC